jgi:arabinose-5-phosphate isomerase
MNKKLALAARAADDNWVASARRSVTIERQGLEALHEMLGDGLGQAFRAAVELLRGIHGRAILTGMGKSGHIARKVAATLASTGTPALFLHAAEASHGDLGMITRDDAVVALSNSGESVELKVVIDYAKRFAVPLIAITSRADSALAAAADVALVLPDAQEACPIGLAPTTSTLLQLALGDALAIALLEDRGFSARDFQALHPGGKLGAALTHIGAIMRRPPDLPLATVGTLMSEAIMTMSVKAAGCLGVLQDGILIGIVTDGDLRRHMSGDLLAQPVESVMTAHPRTITREALAAEALEQLNSHQITALFVVDEATRPVGLIHIHDLLRHGVS